MKKTLISLVVVMLISTTGFVGSVGEVNAAKKLQVYDVNGVAKNNGEWKVRCDFLVPTQFTWAENGIPLSVIVFTDKNGNKLSNQTWNGTQRHFVFSKDLVNLILSDDRKEGGYNYGFYWRKFYYRGIGLLCNPPIWLSVWNLEDLLY